MNDNINLKIQNFQKQFKNVINNSNLPIGIIYLIFQKYYMQIQQQYYATLNSLILEEQKSQNKETKEQNQKQD